MSNFNERLKIVEEALAAYPTLKKWFWFQLGFGHSYNAGIEMVTDELIEQHAMESKLFEEANKWGDDKGTTLGKEPVITESIEDDLLNELLTDTEEPVAEGAVKAIAPKTKKEVPEQKIYFNLKR